MGLPNYYIFLEEGILAEKLVEYFLAPGIEINQAQQ
jgi:hypothetical protein